MAIIIRIEVDASVVALSDTMTAHPTLSIEPVGVVGGVHQRSSPLVRTRWADEGPPGAGTRAEPEAGEALLATLTADETVATATLFADEEDGHLFWVDWADQGLVPETLFPPDLRIVIASLSGQGGTWEYKLICADHETVSALSEHWAAGDVPVTPLGVAWDESLGAGQFAGLTKGQAEALSIAHDDGYYEIPRDVNLKDLADTLGISHSALSERLRRGHEGLVADHFAPDEAADEPSDEE